MEFDDSLFTALRVCGTRLEFQGEPLLQAGDSVERLRWLPMVKPLRLEDGRRVYQVGEGVSLRSLQIGECDGKITDFVIDQLY